LSLKKEGKAEADLEQSRKSVAIDATQAPCLGNFYRCLYIGQEVDAKELKKETWSAAYIISLEPGSGEDSSWIGRGGGPPDPQTSHDVTVLFLASGEQHVLPLWCVQPLHSRSPWGTLYPSMYPGKRAAFLPPGEEHWVEGIITSVEEKAVTLELYGAEKVQIATSNEPWRVVPIPSTAPVNNVVSEIKHLELEEVRAFENSLNTIGWCTKHTPSTPKAVLSILLGIQESEINVKIGLSQKEAALSSVFGDLAEIVINSKEWRDEWVTLMAAQIAFDRQILVYYLEDFGRGFKHPRQLCPALEKKTLALTYPAVPVLINAASSANTTAIPRVNQTSTICDISDSDNPPPPTPISPLRLAYLGKGGYVAIYPTPGRVRAMLEARRGMAETYVAKRTLEIASFDANKLSTISSKGGTGWARWFGGKKQKKIPGQDALNASKPTLQAYLLEAASERGGVYWDAIVPPLPPRMGNHRYRSAIVENPSLKTELLSSALKSSRDHSKENTRAHIRLSSKLGLTMGLDAKSEEKSQTTQNISNASITERSAPPKNVLYFSAEAPLHTHETSNSTPISPITSALCTISPENEQIQTGIKVQA